MKRTTIDRHTVTVEIDGALDRPRAYASLAAANEAARAAIRNGASLAVVRNSAEAHCRTWEPTGPGNTRPRSYTFSGGKQVYSR